MKINEFKNKLSRCGFSVDESADGLLTIYLGKYPLLTFNQGSNMFSTVKLNLNTVPVIDIYGLFNLLEITKEYVDTPIKERFPEKKYVLSAMRCAEGPVPVKQYVDAMNISTNNVEFHFGFANEKANAMEFTQKELDDLSDFFPKDAIDAMKEPVGDENNGN
ncbi:hypothetical protein LTY59_06985 [Limosilactobacillus balticus]|uniref:Uncharacterized protein n=1 Tax=Limosilactobacillus balticus TaxID=2759747 RepID=A0ABS8RES5_9LACO|nr:hypothetical protein [Limosilactobacillus balticus]MBB1109468.1 hypothetical protein [Limosilactobacillus balticus]MCD7138965.1 hypothetical protein [Limosilactobacillus balticus]